MITRAELDRLLQSPAAEPPFGVTPNLKNPPIHLWTERLLTMTMCLVFTALFVIMRMYTKLFVIKKHGWEDYTCFLAWILSIPYEFFHLFSYKYGAGVHIWNISVDKYSSWAKFIYAKELYNGPLIYLTKLSILLQVERIFVSRRSGSIYWCIRTVIWINTLYYMAFDLAIAFHCRPIHKAWQPWVPGHCVNVPVLIIAASLINIASDILILFIPLFCISKLQMQTSRKFGVATVFALGIFTCVTSILRTMASFKLAREKDVTYVMVSVSLWSDAEIAGGIICGCMPVMPQFVRHLTPKLKSVFGTNSLDQKKNHHFRLSVKPPIPKQYIKSPDPYADSCNLTSTSNSESLPNVTTTTQQNDNMHATVSVGKVSPDVREQKGHVAQDLESGNTSVTLRDGGGSLTYL